MVRSRVFASAVAFALAVLIATTLHELAHAVAGLAQGGSPDLFGFSVDQGSQSDGEQVASALAGPLFSLISGLLALTARGERLPSFWRLVWIWFGLASVQSFNGYLITGPFVDAGDIGKVWALWDVGSVVPWVGFAVGWSLTVLLGRLAADRLGALVDAPTAVGTQLPALGVYGWLVGTAVGVVLSLGLLGAGGVGGDVAIFSALGLMASGVCVAFVGVFRSRAEASAGSASWAVAAFPVGGAVALVVVALLRQVVLGSGLSL